MLDYVHILGDVMKAARLKLGLTQGQLAEQADVDVRTVLNIENYKGNPKMEVLFPLIRALRLDSNTIFFPEQESEDPCIFQLHRLLSECADEEIKILLPICETVLTVFRASNTIKIEDK